MATIRPVRPQDVDAVVRIAAAGGSPDADERYVDFVAAHGRLLVAVDEHDAVVGFAGAVAVGDVTMVTDLFVDPDHRGHGVGSAVLHAVLDGSVRRMTCSSTHPAAQAAYIAAGLAPRWRLLTMRGLATGGATPLAPAPWRHDRLDLVQYCRGLGAVVAGDAVVLTDVVAGRRVHTVLRLVTDDPASALDGILSALPADDEVVCSVPEPHPIVPVLDARGFSVEEHDVFFATDGVHLASELASVHRGLL
ncbi:MAG: GNAT family N-acetyltransferase [Ilumatobacteraceae bacterium]